MPAHNQLYYGDILTEDRRCVAMITKKLVVPSGDGWVLAPEAPAEEKK
jgi:hypothetical protein